MPSLLLIVFLIEAAVRIVNAIGAAKLNDLLWTGFNYLPVSTSKAASEQRKLQADYLAVRREMNATSSQDEFAKWAKLRRKHDKLLEQLDASKKSLEAARSGFDRLLTTARILLTRAPQYIIPFWYGKEPMFWLPHGWFPYYAEWIISFPRAPVGSVSIASWQLACTGIVLLASDLISGLANLLLGGNPTKQQAVPVKSATAGEKQDAAKNSSETASAEEKKTS